MSKVLIGHASINEKGTITGGAAGDQTGKEVCTREWYKHKQGRWLVFRPDDPGMAERMAACTGTRPAASSKKALLQHWLTSPHVLSRNLKSTMWKSISEKTQRHSAHPSIPA